MVQLSQKRQGYALLGVAILGFILVSLLALLLQKTIYINKINRSWLERRTLFIELDSLTEVFKDKLVALDATSLSQTDNNFLDLRVDMQNRWLVVRKPLQSGTVEFEVRYLPKNLRFKRVVNHP